MKVLVVEDEPKLATVLRDYLVAAGMEVEVQADGAEVVEHVRRLSPDIVLLDVMLPHKDGLTICRELRAFSQVPIILLTARVEEVDRILGLELGADDYLCKPYSPREVLARVSAIMRRVARRPQLGTDGAQTTPGAPGTGAAGVSGPSDARGDGGGSPTTNTLQPWSPLPGLVLDAGRMQVQLDGAAVDVTPVEFRLLTQLAKTPGRIWNRRQLMAHVYEDERVVTERTIDSHIKNLRKKLGTASSGREVIESVYGVGYRLVDE